MDRTDDGESEIEALGIPVRLHLDPPTADPEAYDPEHVEWVEDDNMPDRGYARIKRELLCVEATPVQGSAGLATEAYRIPLCYTDELHRFDIYNRHRGVQMGLGAYGRLRARYHGRAAVLMGRVRGAILVLNGRTRVEGSDRFNLVRDNDVRALLDCGAYHEQRLHLDL